MNKKAKRLLAMLLTTVMVTSSVGTVAFAEGEHASQQATATIEETETPLEIVPEEGTVEEPMEVVPEEGSTETPVETVPEEGVVEEPVDSDAAVEPSEEAVEAVAEAPQERISMGQKPADGQTTGQPFAAYTGGSQYFRIPALVTLSDGTLVAASDARWNTTEDAYGLDTIVSRSSDKGATWNYTFANYLGDNGNVRNGDSTAFIDPALAVTKDDTIYMLVDLYPHGGVITSIKNGTGYDTNGHLKLAKKGNSTFAYYLGDFVGGKAQIYDNKGNVVSGYEVDEYFNIRGNGVNTNLFFSDSPYQVLKTSYLYLTVSHDKGATWSAPKMLNSQVKKDTDKFYGVGPGRGLVTSTGRIIFPCYTFTTSDGNTSVIYSDDNGETWTRSEPMARQSSEATLVEADGKLYMFTRHGGYYVSSDNGTTWGSKQTVKGISYNTGCQTSAITYSKKIDGKTAILWSAPGNTGSRSNGKIFVGLVQENGTINWAYTYSVNIGDYSYSCLTELNDGSIGLLYENAGGSILYKNFDIHEIAPNAEIEKPQFKDETGATITAVAFADGETTAKTVSVSGLEVNEQISVVSNNQNVVTAEAAGNQITLTPVGVGTAKVTATVESATRAVGESMELTVTVERAGQVPIIPNGTVTEVNKEDSTTYELDVDGVDTGSEYLIVSGTHALTNKGGSTSTGDTTIKVNGNGNVATVSGEDTDLLWTFTGSGDQYTIKNASAYIWLQKEGLSVKVLGKDATVATVVNKGNGEYTIQTSVSNQYLIWYAFLGTHKFDGAKNPQNLKLFKKVVTPGPTVYKTDVTHLNEQITIADQLNAAAYTADSWAVLETAVNNARKLATAQEYETKEAAEAAQKEIDAAAQEIANAIAALKKVPVVVNVVIGQSVNVEGVKGALDESGLNQTIAKVQVSGTTMTVTGLTEGNTSVVVGDTTYEIHVTKVPEVLDTATTPFLADVTNNNVTEAKPLTKLTLSKGFTFNVKLNSKFAGKKVEWSTEDPSIAKVDKNGKVTGVSEGTTKLIAKIDGVAYAIPVVIVGNNGASKYAKYKVCDLHVSEITNTTVWYSWNVSGDKAKFVQAVEGESIYVAYPSTATHCINFYGKPDAGHALTFMSATNSYGQYLALQNKKDPTKCDFYTQNGAGKNEITLFGATEVKNDIQVALDLGCDGAQGFSRGRDNTNNVDCDLSFRSEKLPTVSKEVASVNGKPYEEGMVAKVGDEIIFNVRVTQYAADTQSGDIAYTNEKLTDQLADATFVGTKSNTKYINLSDTALSKDKVTTYQVKYIVKDSDLDKTIKNIVDLSYTYKSAYSSGSYDVTANAEASISASTFAPKDIVVDFGLPVTMDYANDHGHYNLVSGTSKLGVADVSVENNVVTYKPNQVLKEADTVTITNTEGGTSTFKVYPATSVYYEEGFATFNEGGSWTSASKGTASQATDYVASTTLYGNDDAYVSEQGHSAGTAAISSTKNDIATINFNGTGIDVYTLTTATSGMMSCWLYDANNTLVKFAYVDTHQAYLENSTGNFYNTPVLSYTGLKAGDYKLLVRVEQGEIALDGFKVYNTKGNAYDAVYVKDQEDKATNVEVRNIVIAQAKYNVEDLSDKHQIAGNIMESVYSATNNGSGAIILDSNGTTPNPEIQTDMVNKGPKNEMYLTKGQAVAMKITGNASKVAVGMRSLNGGEVQYKVNEQSKTLNSTVDMYHAVEPNKDKMIVIQNTGETVLALTKIKATQFNGANGVELATNVTADEDTVAYALMCMTLEPEPQPPVEPENPEVPMADATANIKLVDYRGKALATTTVAVNGQEGTEAVIAGADLKAAAEQVLPKGYAFADESKIADETVICGQSKDVKVQIGKVATLTVTYKKLFGKKVGTATFTAVQTSSSKRHTFSAAEIRKAAPKGYRVLGGISTKVKFGAKKDISARVF